MISKLSSFAVSALMVMTYSDVEYNVLAQQMPNVTAEKPAPKKGDANFDPFATTTTTTTTEEKKPPPQFAGTDDSNKGSTTTTTNGSSTTPNGSSSSKPASTSSDKGTSSSAAAPAANDNTPKPAAKPAPAAKDDSTATTKPASGSSTQGTADKPAQGQAAADKNAFGITGISDDLQKAVDQADKDLSKEAAAKKKEAEEFGPIDLNKGYDLNEFEQTKTKEDENADDPEEKIERPKKATDVDPLANEVFTNKLSCNICIRAGYTYMYQNLKGATQYYRQIDRFSDYDGYCCKKEVDGSYNCGELTTKNAAGLDVTSKITLTGKPNSNDFLRKELALAACPTKESICGKKQHYLWGVGAKAEEVTVSISNNAAQKLVKVNKGESAGFTQRDECHWLIQTRCGLPTIQILPDYIYEFDANGEQTKPDPSLKLPTFYLSDQYLRLSYMEWQPALNPDMDLNGLFPGPKSIPVDVGPAYVQAPGEFPDFKQKVFNSKKENTGYKRLFPAYLITENIKTFFKKVDAYNVLKSQYNEDREEYNAAVRSYQALKRQYAKAQEAYYAEEQKRIEDEGETAEPRRGEPTKPNGRPATVSENFRTDLYLAYVQAWAIATEAFVAMPKRPRIPANPPVYEGFQFEDFELFQGYGYFTAGILSLNTWQYGTIKSFGTLGQSEAPLNQKFWKYSDQEKKEYTELKAEKLEELKKEAKLYNLTLNGTKLVEKKNSTNSTTKTDTTKTAAQRFIEQFMQNQSDMFNLLNQAAANTTTNTTANASKNASTNTSKNASTNATANATKPKPPPPRLFKFDDEPPRRPPKNQSGILNGFALGDECTPRFVLLSLMPNTISASKWPFQANNQGVKVVMSSEYMDQSRPLNPPEAVDAMIPSSNTLIIRPGVDPSEAAALADGEAGAMALGASALAAGLVALSLF